MRARLQDLRGDRFAELDPFRLGGAVGNCAEIDGERGLHFGLSLRINAGKHRAGGRRSRGFLGDRRRGRELHQVRLVEAFDRVDGVEHRDMGHGHDPLRRRRPQLVAEHIGHGLLVPIGDDIGACRLCQAD
jgi:hypothetical protein